MMYIIMVLVAMLLVFLLLILALIHFCRKYQCIQKCRIGCVSCF